MVLQCDLFEYKSRSENDVGVSHMSSAGLRQPIRYRKVSGGVPMSYADVVVMWNHSLYHPDQGVETSNQISGLRMAFNGQRFAYAHRNDALRRRAFQRVREAFPDHNRKSTWKDYFDYIAKGRIPFPEQVPNFRPTLDWALTRERFGFFLELRRERRHAKRAEEASATTI